MTKLDDKYLPPAERQLETVRVQIGEAQAIAFRLTLEIREYTASGEKNKVEESEINLKRMKEKIDLLMEIHEEMAV